MKYSTEDIFTPQGLLKDVQKNPKLDFLMNIFQIPRAFGVSGFGESWSVGKHSVAAAFLGLFWAKYNGFSEEKTHKLVTLALLHDMHEAVTGDILPMFKSETVKAELEQIQRDILKALNVVEDNELKKDLKVIDLIAFLYEIKQVSPNILNKKRQRLALEIANKQKRILFDYCRHNEIDLLKVEKFLSVMEI